MILASLLRDCFVNLPDRNGCQSPAVGAVTAKKSTDMATFTADGPGRKALLGIHVSGELFEEMLVLWNWQRLQSSQKLEPLLGRPNEVFSGLFGILQFVVAGLTVRPSAGSCFNVYHMDRAFWLEIHLIDDHQKFMGFTPQGSARTTDVLTMLEKANTCIEKR